MELGVTKINNVMVICGDITFPSDFECVINDVKSIMWVNKDLVDDDKGIDFVEDIVLKQYDAYVVPTIYHGNIYMNLFSGTFLIKEDLEWYIQGIKFNDKQCFLTML